MKPSIMESRIRKIIVLLFWLGLWQMGYWIVGKEVLVPSPFSTLCTLVEMMKAKEFYLQIGWTLIRVVEGVGLSAALGFVTAWMSYKSSFFRELLTPMIALMKSTPLMAIIILALIWFKAHEVTVFVCVLMCYPMIYTNLLTGLEHLDQELVEMSKVFQVKKRFILLKCYWPQLRKYVLASLELSFGMGWKVVIAAEVLALPKYAIGDALLSAKHYIETPQVFAWIIVIVFLSQCCEKCVHWMIKRGEFSD